MKSATMRSVLLLLALSFIASICSATTFFVGPNSQYPTPCSAIYTGSSVYQGQPVAQPGDIVEIDYNNGIPYQEPPDNNHGGRSDCKILNATNLTIIGVGGRPVLDGTGAVYQKAIIDIYASGVTVSNLEIRNVRCDSNCAAVRVNSGSNGSPDGGDTTVEYSYLHDNEDGILTGNIGPGVGAYTDSNPYITLAYDEFYNNGNNDSNSSQFGETHNMYIGFDSNVPAIETFNMWYTWSHDSFVGHTVKDRSPYSNIEYNLIGDAAGNSSYILDFPLGGSTYVVGNTVYKAYSSNINANQNYMIFADEGDNSGSDPEYGTTNQDLHFVNNTVILDPANWVPSYVPVSCAYQSNSSNCPSPGNGPALSTAAVVENNLFVGPANTPISNQTGVVTLGSNFVVTNNSTGGGGWTNLLNGSNISANFVNAPQFNFELTGNTNAVGWGIDPPTYNDGSTPDWNAYANDEFVMPNGSQPRNWVSDAGAYSFGNGYALQGLYNLSVAYSPAQLVYGAGTVTLTVTGFPATGTGGYTIADFISENPAVLGSASASTTTSSAAGVLTIYNPSADTIVPVDVYVDGSWVQATVYVGPGPGSPTSGTGPGIAGPPAYYIFEGGNAQTAQLGQNYANPIVVGVFDSAGRPVPGVTVTVSGACVNGGSATTVTSGINTGLASITLAPTVSQSCVNVASPAPLDVNIGGSDYGTYDWYGDTTTENGSPTILSAGTPSGPAAVLWGGSATFTGSFTNYGLPTGAVITFTCTQTTSIAGISCSQPASVTLTAGQTVVPYSVTVTTTGVAKSDAPSIFHGALPISFAALFAVFCFRRKSVVKYLLLALAALSIFGMSACSSNPTPVTLTPIGNASFVVTASSTTGPVTTSAPFKLSVNQ